MNLAKRAAGFVVTLFKKKKTAHLRAKSLQMQRGAQTASYNRAAETCRQQSERSHTTQLSPQTNTFWHVSKYTNKPPAHTGQVGRVGKCGDFKAFEEKVIKAQNEGIVRLFGDFLAKRKAH